MGKIFKWLFCILLVCLLAASAVIGFGILLPFHNAQTHMEEDGSFTITQLSDGSLSLAWPEAEGADIYQIELLQSPGDGSEPKVVYRQFTEEASGHVLPELPANITLILQVCSGAEYETLLEKGTRFSENMLQATVSFDIPVLSALDANVDVGNKALVLNAQPEEGQVWQDEILWQYQLLDGSGEELAQQIVSTPETTVRFDTGAIPMPEEDETYRLVANALRQSEGLILRSSAVRELTITRDMLTQWELNPVITKNAKYSHTITWEENFGLDYEVQMLDAETNDWETVAEVAAGEERRYTSPTLEPNSVYQYRVVSIDPKGSKEYAAVSDPLTFETGDMVAYATVWPVKDLTAFKDSHWNRPMATAKVGQAYCVLGEENGMFAVRINDMTCYIDSNYCLINLPEYLGGLCSYNITNSVYSIYAVHEFGIPDVTGVVSPGYEDVYQDDGSFLVPLLYPTAQKLATAAEKAAEQGYKLKIYDSFRPYITTRDIYDRTEKVLYMELPETTYTGAPRDTITDLPETFRPGSDKLDLGWVMTGHNYVLNAFLARNGSTHNLGIALDLTLEDLETGEEIPMQTSMHDLSQYSVLSKNNDAADTLSTIMHGSGFGGLISEWWHFQDNVTKSRFALPYVQNGVSAECWVKDDFGWKYRTAKGSFYQDETVSINGYDYTFDANGYQIG